MEHARSRSTYRRKCLIALDHSALFCDSSGYVVLEQSCLKLRHPDLGDISQPPGGCLHPAVAQKLCQALCPEFTKVGIRVFSAWTHHVGVTVSRNRRMKSWQHTPHGTQPPQGRPWKGQCLGTGSRAKAGRMGDLGNWLCRHG